MKHSSVQGRDHSQLLPGPSEHLLEETWIPAPRVLTFKVVLRRGTRECLADEEGHNAKGAFPVGLRTDLGELIVLLGSSQCLLRRFAVKRRDLSVFHCSSEWRRRLHSAEDCTVATST